MKVMCQFSASNVYMSQFRQNEWKTNWARTFALHTRKPMCSVRSNVLRVPCILVAFVVNAVVVNVVNSGTQIGVQIAWFLFLISATLCFGSSSLLCGQYASTHSSCFFLIAILSFIIYCMEWKLKSNHAIFHETGKLLFRHYHHRHHSVKSWGIKVGNIAVACPRFL